MVNKYLVLAIVAAVALATVISIATFTYAQSNGVNKPLLPPCGKGNVTKVWIPFVWRWRGFGWGAKVRGLEIVVSDEFKQKVVSILGSDSDTASLLSQEYNITHIKPVITMIVSGDGTVTFKATKAIVELCNGKGGRAVVYVDVEGGKVLAIYKFEAVVKTAKTTTPTTPSSSA
jgi:hypothetical protein